VLWRIGIDTRAEGALALQALVDETLYATTQRGIYAINAQDGQIRWLYQPDTQSMLSGPPVVADQLLYAGTRSYLCALDVTTGTEAWRYRLGHACYPEVYYLGAWSTTRRSMSARVIAACTLSRRTAGGCAGNTNLPPQVSVSTQPPSPMTSSTSPPTEPMRSAARRGRSSGTRTWGVLLATLVLLPRRSSRVTRSIWCAWINVRKGCSTRSLRARERSVGTPPIPLGEHGSPSLRSVLRPLR
jgi:PQQ-like domain